MVSATVVSMVGAVPYVMIPDVREKEKTAAIMDNVTLLIVRVPVMQGGPALDVNSRIVLVSLTAVDAVTA